MTNLLEENHIALPEFAKRCKCKQGNGKAKHALGAWVKINSIFSISDSHSDISELETSIPSLEKFPVSSSKLPPKTSHFSLDFDVPSERSSQIHSDLSISDFEYDIHPMTVIDSFPQPSHDQETHQPSSSLVGN